VPHGLLSLISLMAGITHDQVSALHFLNKRHQLTTQCKVWLQEAIEASHQTGGAGGAHSPRAMAGLVDDISTALRELRNSQKVAARAARVELEGVDATVHCVDLSHL